MVVHRAVRVRRYALAAAMMAVASVSWAQDQGAPPKVRYAPAESYDQILCLVFSPDGGMLLACNNKGPVDILKPPLGQRLGWFFARKFLSGLVFLPNGELVAGYCSSRDDVFLLDTKTWKPSGVLPTPDAGVRSVAVSPDGKFLAAVCEEPKAIDALGYPHVLILWQFPSRKRVREIRWNEDYGEPTIQFSRDSETLVIAQSSIVFWNVKTGSKIRTIADAHADKAHSVAVNRLAFLPDGTRLVSAGMDRSFSVTIKVWNVTTGQILQTLRGHGEHEFVNALIPLPKERVISAGTCDSTIRLWDISAGRQVAQLKTGGNPHCFALSPDGKTLVCNLMTRDLRIWKLTDVFPVLTETKSDAPP